MGVHGEHDGVRRYWRSVPGDEAVTDLELIMSLYDAWDRGDLETILEHQHPDVEWHTSGAFPGMTGIYRGHDGVRRYWRDVRAPFERFEIAPQRVLRDGNPYLIEVRFRATGIESGVEVEMRFLHEVTMRDGMFTTVRAMRP